ncbi:MAG: hypothetical protein HEQ22_14740 [Sphingopyxis sp.]|uniref:hypothetical protein n=1 Tax=Sphingopyxis sp. TaxID=1908224 RepID=UPI003D811D3A
MEQDSRYLQNQSRRLHALYRRNRRFLNIFVTSWLITFLSLFLLATVDRIGALEWGYADDMWVLMGFALFGAIFWIFASLMSKLNLHMSAIPTDLNL